MGSTLFVVVGLAIAALVAVLAFTGRDRGGPPAPLVSAFDERDDDAFVVECPVQVKETQGGVTTLKQTGMSRLYVGSQARAEEVVAQGAANGVARTWRRVPLVDVREDARENLQRARAEAAAASSAAPA